MNAGGRESGGGIAVEFCYRVRRRLGVSRNNMTQQASGLKLTVTAELFSVVGTWRILRGKCFLQM